MFAESKQNGFPPRDRRGRHGKRVEIRVKHHRIIDRLGKFQRKHVFGGPGLASTRFSSAEGPPSAGKHCTNTLTKSTWPILF